MTTSVRSTLTKAPPGPSSGRWKLTAAPATGLPVSSVISTVIWRVLRDPGRCTAPSPSITRICRMATWASAGAAHRRHKAANPPDLRYKTSFRRVSAPRWAELSGFSNQHDRHVVRTAVLLGRFDQIAAAFLQRSATVSAIEDLFHLRRFQHAVQSVAANEYQIALRQGHPVVVDLVLI